MKKLSLFIMLFLGMMTKIVSQEMHCMVIRLPEKYLIEESQVIVRATVTAKKSFWNDKRTRIFTSHQLQVLEVLKGNVPQQIELIAQGGVLPEMEEAFADRIDLEEGEEAFFMLAAVPQHWNGIQKSTHSYACWASLQSVFRVDPYSGNISDIFNAYRNTNALRSAVSGYVSQAPVIFPGGNAIQIPPSSGNSTAAVVSSISPTVTTAGTKSILTITGSGFGATRGNGFVEFTTSSGSGTFGKPFAKDYLSWTDTEIRVFVPSRLIGLDTDVSAATGPVRVTPSGGVAAASVGNLTVKYSLFTVILTGGDTAYTMRAAGMNGAGGYTLAYNDQFVNSFGTNAKSIVERCMVKWTCATGYNWTTTNTTTSIRGVANDGVNVITDDVLEPLPSNVAGRGVNHLGGCGSGSNFRVVTTTMDMIINDLPGGFLWNVSDANPPANRVDFESVMIHEFGHLHQISHTLNTSSEVMAASVNVGTSRRNLTQNDIDAGNHVMSLSNVQQCNGAPGHTPMSRSISISTTSVFPVCSQSEVTFTATTNNVTANSILVWKRNGVVSGNGNTFSFFNPANNEVITCELQGCSSVVSNSIVVTTTTVGHINGPLCVVGEGTITAQYIGGLIQSGGPGVGGDLIIPTWILSPGITSIDESGALLTASFSPTFTSGTIRIVYFSPTCNANIDASINVVRGPSATISYAQTSYCRNITSAQSVSRTGTAGGVYSTSPTGLSINSSTGALTPSTSTAGTYTVSYTLPATGNCGPFVATTTVTIVNTPLATFQFLNPNFCRSNTGTVLPTTISPAGGTFTASPAGLSFNSSTGGIRPNLSTAGTYTLTYTVAGTGGCGPVSTSRSVTIINQLATPGAISGTANSFCNTSRTFSVAAVAGASSYQWTIPTGTTISGNATGNSIVLVAGAGFTGGTLSVRAIASNGCNSNLRSLTLSPVPAQPGTITISNISLLNASGTASVAAVPGATSYTWTATGATILSGQGTRTISLLATASTGTLCVRATNACGTSVSRCSTYTVPVFAPVENKDDQLSSFIGEDMQSIPVLFPNPATDKVSVRFEEDWLGDEYPCSIFGIDGRTYLSRMVIPGEESTEEFDISALPAGIYLLKISSSSGYTTLRFIKQ